MFLFFLCLGPPFQVELESSGEGGTGEYLGSKLGLYEMMPAKKKGEGQRVYRQLHVGDIKQSYLDKTAYRYLYR